MGMWIGQIAVVTSQYSHGPNHHLLHPKCTMCTCQFYPGEPARPHSFTIVIPWACLACAGCAAGSVGLLVWVGVPVVAEFVGLGPWRGTTSCPGPGVCGLLSREAPGERPLKFLPLLRESRWPPCRQWTATSEDT